MGSDTIYDGRKSYTYTPFDIPDSITQISGGNINGGGTRTITPSAFSVPLAISQPSSNHTNGTLSIQYGYTGDRVRLTERRPNRPTATPSNQHVNLTTYLLAGATALFEEDRLGAGNSSEPFRYRYKHSINTPEGTVSIVVIDAPWGGSGSSSMRSDRTFHRDHLGSTVAITDENGTEFLGYDAWGKRRNANGQDNNIAAWVGLSSKTDRGYTGHEHIDDIGLIHMNGRLYDPITGRMMSADPIIQAPYLLQNYNRYSYVMNNPLSLTDPSGFSWWTRWRRPLLAIAVAWAIGPAGFWQGGITGNAFASTMVAGFASGGIMGGNIESALQGAFTAAMFYGVGEISGMHDPSVLEKGFLSNAHIAQTAGHAVVGCFSASIAGGSCGSGAASAGFAAAAGPLLPGADISPERFVSRVIVGGIGSRLAGDKFANGATSAAFAYLFNDVAGRAHKYKLGPTWMCDMDQSGCTMSATLDVVDKRSLGLLQKLNGPPTEGYNSLKPTNDPIWHVVDRENFKVFNITLEGHQFHPGAVEHALSIDTRSRWSWGQFRFQSVEAIYLTTTGTGTGANPVWNNYIGREIFGATHAWSQREMQRRANRGAP